MIAVEEAVARILDGLAPLPAETLALPLALGRVLAQDLAARVSQPPAAVSAMDGYAVRAADVAAVPAVLRVVGEAPAGGSHPHPLGPGEAVRIFTGGPLPAGADAIVIQEDCTREGGQVTVREAAAAGRYVRPAGLDFAAGEVVLRAGRRLTARDLGLAASMNHAWVTVHRRPRVAILSTGDEVVRPGDPIGPNQIVSSNAYALAGALRSFGAEPVDLGIARDRTEDLVEKARGAFGTDLLVTTGGASVGDHDLVQPALKSIGLDVGFWQIAMRPGKPLMFGKLGSVPVIGLPGNPVSNMVCALVFLAPALARLSGAPPAPPPPMTALLGSALPANDRRQDYLRATLATDAEGRRVATPFGRQDSSMLSRLAHADCLVVRPPLDPPRQPGDSVAILAFPAGPFPF